MNPHRSADRLRGAASLVATALLLFGVPLGLIVFVGWPLPTTMPSTDSLTQAINTGISDAFIVKALALIAWGAWVQIALALVVEAAAAVRGRQPATLPLPPGFQVAAARLVAGIVMLLGPLQPLRAVAATPPRPPAVESVQLTAVPVRGPSPDVRIAPSDRPVERIAPTAPARTVTVARHETYWSIAERELGDGLRWQELQAANIGRTMADGTVVVAGDQMLRAGWTLEVPGAEKSAAPAGMPVEIVVEDGDNLWDLSEERLGADLGHEPSDAQTAPYWSEVIEANRGRLADPVDPSLIYPGQVLAMPATGVGAPAPPVEPTAPDDQERTEEALSAPAPSESLASEEDPTPSVPTTTAPSAETTTTTEAAQPESAAPSNPSADEPAPKSVAATDDGASFPWMLAGGGLGSIALAVGAKRLVERRRRAYVTDHDAVDLPPPDPEQRPLFQEVVAAADEDRIGELQRALGELSNAFAEGGAEARPRLVRHEEGSLEVLLDRPTSVAPAGWTSDGEGLVLTLNHDIDPDADFDGPSCPAPLMVTIGQPDEGAHLYLDLEADGVIALVGDVEAARRLARSMLTELALSPLADGNRVITIGDLVASEAAGLPQLTRKETWYDFAEDLQAWISASHEALTTNGWPNAFVARGRDPDHEALMPMVIVATKPPPPEILDRLMELRPSAAAIVVADETDGALTVIECEPDEIRLDDVDLVFAPQQVDESELEDLGRLFVIPDLDRDLGDSDVREGLELDDAAPHRPPPADAPPDYEILVRLLGDIRVEGCSKPLHPKPTAVTAYLALNRSVTSERLEEACWFGSDGTSHRKRLRETMTVCRDAIGSQHLPPNKQGMYTIGPGVRTDIDIFEWHVASAVDTERPDAIEHYRAALDLVTGRPFSYSNKARMSFGWVDFEHHATTWEMRIAGVAKAFTELCIDADEPEAAIGPLRRLLQAAPLNGGVVAALMRAHIESGDRLAADHVYEEHVAALDRADLGDPDDEIEQLRLDLRLG